MKNNRAAPISVERINGAAFEIDNPGTQAPVILTDVLNDWRALDLWSPGYLSSRLTEKRVTVAVSPVSEFNYELSGADAKATGNYHLEQMKFSEAIVKICSPKPRSDHYYIMQRSIPEEYPELLRDIRSPRWVNGANPVVNLWLGEAGITTPLHFDRSNNLYAQIFGRKRITLFHPMQTEWLYPYPVKSPKNHLSYVNADRPDLTKYPDFLRTQAMECVLKPGELLLLPAFWWHQFQALEVSISVNFWWPPDISQLFAPNALRILPVEYKKDCLASIKTEILSRAGMDFIGIADLLRKHGRRWAAVLLAGAELEERLRMTSRELRGNEYAAQIMTWRASVEKALLANDALFDDKEVDSVIEGVRLFTCRAR